MAQLGQCSGDQLVGVNDAVCFAINLADTEEAPITIWDDATDYVINGTIMIENNGVSGVGPSAALQVNGVAIGGFIIAPGEARAYTTDNINSISIVGSEGVEDATSNVKVSFSLNYKF